MSALFDAHCLFKPPRSKPTTIQVRPIDQSLVYELIMRPEQEINWRESYTEAEAQKGFVRGCTGSDQFIKEAINQEFDEWDRSKEYLLLPGTVHESSGMASSVAHCSPHKILFIFITSR